MNFLKKMLQDYDMNFKERWIDLSQGVDRGNDSLAGSGIAGCLTGKGIPFVTTHGGARIWHGSPVVARPASRSNC
ncbi:hypothetical protein N7516_007020 [Penicillium verrucosum]|uniref:uncharacterized protein n=1 Tax=Penicillium verrucosum TaxID=60171 RepID=UPI00254524F6|nr:uncharacterized protein N7516_007020 [Penicillium verrucosum]KAJ5932531.1 hypothetical protein N7516_007020 [Penicillium verrucosum]